MTLDLDATVRLDRRQDVRDADRAIEPLAVRRVGGDGDLELLELLGELERGLLLLGGARGALGLELLQAALRGFRRDGGETLREEVVAGVTGGDLDDRAGLAELASLLSSSSSGLSRDM